MQKYVCIAKIPTKVIGVLFMFTGSAKIGKLKFLNSRKIRPVIYDGRTDRRTDRIAVVYIPLSCAMLRDVIIVLV